MKLEWTNGDIWWGEYKDDKMEGYGTYKSAFGDRYIG
jgi:hypothetical protein